MKPSTADSREPMDGKIWDDKTCRSICDAVGERLRRDLRPDSAGPSPYLQSLLDELKRRDTSRSKAADSAGRAFVR
jgi:hypothetical protein